MFIVKNVKLQNTKFMKIISALTLAVLLNGYMLLVPRRILNKLTSKIYKTPLTNRCFLKTFKNSGWSEKIRKSKNSGWSVTKKNVTICQNSRTVLMGIC